MSRENWEIMDQKVVPEAREEFGESQRALLTHAVEHWVKEAEDTCAVATCFLSLHLPLNLPFPDFVSPGDDKFPMLFSHASRSIYPFSEKHMNKFRIF